MENEILKETITAVAYAFIEPNTSAISLAKKHNVSFNQITNWLLEAVEKGYVIEISNCNIIMTKNVEEYEKRNNIQNSSLRALYNAAMVSKKQQKQ